MYQLLLFVHIVCAVIWVGGAVYAQLLALRVRRSPDPSELPNLARHIEYIGSRVFFAGGTPAVRGGGRHDAASLELW